MSVNMIDACESSIGASLRRVLLHTESDETQSVAPNATIDGASDEALVYMCQLIEETSHGIAGRRHACAELCKRYQPLIWKYARHSATYQLSTYDDMESYLWFLFMESIQQYDLNGSVPFAGFIKSAIHYGALNYRKRIYRDRSHEIDVDMTAREDVCASIANASIANASIANASIANASIVDAHLTDTSIADVSITSHDLHRAIQALPKGQQQILRRAYWDGLSLAAIGEHNHTSRQAVQGQHQRALKALRTMLIGHNN